MVSNVVGKGLFELLFFDLCVIFPTFLSSTTLKSRSATPFLLSLFLGAASSSSPGVKQIEKGPDWVRLNFPHDRYALLAFVMGVMMMT